MSERRDPLEALLAEWPVRGPDDATWEDRAVEAIARAEGAGETLASLLEPPALAAEPGEPGSAEPPRSLAELARAKLAAERRDEQRPLLELAALAAAPPAPAPTAPAPAVGEPARPARAELAERPAPAPAPRGGAGRWRSSTVLAVALAVGAAGVAIGLGPLASRGPSSRGEASGGVASAGVVAGAGPAAPLASATEAPAVAAVGQRRPEPGVVDPLAAVPAAGPRGAAGGGGASPGGAGARVAVAPPAPAPPGATPPGATPAPGEDEPPPLPGARNAEKGGELPEKPSSGAVQAALGAVMGAARSCVAGHDQASAVTVVFGSDGRVTSVAVSGGPAAGTPAAACIQAALGRARVEPFARATFSVGATVRPP